MSERDPSGSHPKLPNLDLRSPRSQEAAGSSCFCPRPYPNPTPRARMGLPPWQVQKHRGKPSLPYICVHGPPRQLRSGNPNQGIISNPVLLKPQLESRFTGHRLSLHPGHARGRKGFLLQGLISAAVCASPVPAVRSQPNRSGRDKIRESSRPLSLRT